MISSGPSSAPSTESAQLGVRLADRFLVQGIAGVFARIDEIHSRVSQPPVPGEFRALLDARMATTSSTASTTADHSTVQGSLAGGFASRAGAVLGTLGVPAGGIATRSQLDTYLATANIEGRNGRLDHAELTPVSGGWNGDARLLPPAASAWESMRAAAAIDGVDLRVIDSYRTYEAQDAAHKAHLRGEKRANVLPPGTSEHGNGLAIDVTNGSIIGRDDSEWIWLQNNAQRFGWYPISNETWHWEFRGV